MLFVFLQIEVMCILCRYCVVLVFLIQFMLLWICMVVLVMWVLIFVLCVLVIGVRKVVCVVQLVLFEVCDMLMVMVQVRQIDCVVKIFVCDVVSIWCIFGWWMIGFICICLDVQVVVCCSVVLVCVMFWMFMLSWVQFIMVNIVVMFLCFLLMIQLVVFLKDMMQVGLLWMFSLCLRLIMCRLLGWLGLFVLFGISFGIMNRLMFLVFVLLLGSCVSIRWQMFEVILLLFQVMKIFCLVM